jgi:hypothetical protein
MSLPKYWKLGAVGASCAVLGAGASVIASAGAATQPSAAGTSSGGTAAQHARGGYGARRLAARAVHGDVVVPSKGGFVTVTFDRGIVQSVSGQQLTLKEGTKKATYKTVTLTIPAGARIRDNRHTATLADVKAGQRVLVVQAPTRTYVVAHDVRVGG